MSSPTSKHRAMQNLRLHSSLQLESLGQGTGARRECSMAFGTTAELVPDYFLPVSPDWALLFNRERTGGERHPFSP